MCISILWFFWKHVCRELVARFHGDIRLFPRGQKVGHRAGPTNFLNGVFETVRREGLGSNPPSLPFWGFHQQSDSSWTFQPRAEVPNGFHRVSGIFWNSKRYFCFILKTRFPQSSLDVQRGLWPSAVREEPGPWLGTVPYFFPPWSSLSFPGAVPGAPGPPTPPRQMPWRQEGALLSVIHPQIRNWASLETRGRASPPLCDFAYLDCFQKYIFKSHVQLICDSPADSFCSL